MRNFLFKTYMHEDKKIYHNNFSLIKQMVNLCIIDKVVQFKIYEKVKNELNEFLIENLRIKFHE